jgi:SAM-dependent methyltransferase
MHSPRRREEVIDDLLLYEDIEFVRRAYRALLGREADASGLDAQVARLRDGSITKLQLLESLQSSTEGRDHGAELAAIAHRRDTERITSAIGAIPLIGPAFEWLWSLAGMPAQLRQQRRTIALLEHQVATMQAAAVERERELTRTLRSHWGSLEDRLIAVAPRATTTAGRVADFYAEFQDHFRGSSEQIRARLAPYLADVERLRQSGRPVIDLGCGRGEWLDMLRSQRVTAVGVDANQSMVDRCRAIGLTAEHADALEFLRRSESASAAVITGFHIAEHLAIESLLMLLDESLRVLMPGGFLILETPNPENVLMGACDFYIDPTHERPIPPVTLEFMARRAGFVDVELRRLNPAQAPDYSSDLAHAVSRFTMAGDYAIVAVKQPG